MSAQDGTSQEKKAIALSIRHFLPSASIRKHASPTLELRVCGGIHLTLGDFVTFSIASEHEMHGIDDTDRSKRVLCYIESYAKTMESINKAIEKFREQKALRSRSKLFLGSGRIATR